MKFIWAFLIGFVSAYIVILVFGLWQAKNAQKVFKNKAEKAMSAFEEAQNKNDKGENKWTIKNKKLLRK